jgi:lysophospholipase L1-like esterase
MPTRTILCYGDSNTHGTVPATGPFDRRRFPEDVRWPGMLRAALGDGWTVIEEGLPGRTTVHDDPLEGVHKNGLSHLRACLESHRPVDVLVIMLGTNDLKTRFSVPPGDIARGVGRLCETALACEAGPSSGAPKLVVVAPVPIIEAGHLGEMFGGGAAKSERLAPLYEELAAQLGAAFLDAGTIARVSPIDGVHLEADQHRALGEALAQVVAKL